MVVPKSQLGRQARLVGNIILVFAIAFISKTLCGSEFKPVRAQLPNVVIFIADDLGWGDVGFHKGKETPNIDQLAKEGLELTRFYAFPACSPSRAAFLTGRFPHRMGISGPVRHRDPGIPTEEVLLSEWMQQQGAQTNLVGKWHLGETPQTHPNACGFEAFYGLLGASVDYYEHSTNGRVDWYRNESLIQEEGYSTELLADEAVRCIEQRDESRPLFLLCSFNAPHSPFQPPPAAAKNAAGDREAVYSAMVGSLDDAVGRVMDTLNKQGLRKDTLVIFFSDNGAPRIGDNGDFRGGKRTVYEGGIRMPCVVNWPGKVPQGQKTDALVAIYDLFPTIASALGRPIQGELQNRFDGVDQWNVLLGDRKTERQGLAIAETDFAWIEKDWKLIQSAAGTELFSLSKDPQESSSLAKVQMKELNGLQRNAAKFQDSLGPARDLMVAIRVAESPTTDDSDATKPEHVFIASNELQGEDAAALPSTFTLVGDAQYARLGDERVETSGSGVRFQSGADLNSDGKQAAELAATVQIQPNDGRWFRLGIQAMAQDGFQVGQDNLYLKVEFSKDGGGDSLDHVRKRFYGQVEMERAKFADDRTNKNLGLAVWRGYYLDFKTPFPEVDTLRVSVGFENGEGNEEKDELWINEMELVSVPEPSIYKKTQTSDAPELSLEAMVHIGGRWYFDPQGGNAEIPKVFDYSNAHQLVYSADGLHAPFAGNMSSWLRKGYLDIDGNEVNEDRFIADAVQVTFTDQHLVMKSRNLPNHPTASFPDRWRMLDGNPAYIKEQAATWYLPLEPEVDPNHFAMVGRNDNQALPMGPIGVATNGVIFFNPFDHIYEADAVWRLDRCCGHPSPRNQYHYHKYPVCVKSPWSDDGTGHSPIIGFAFDGFPVYGPYESQGELAKDSEANPLNEFNVHKDLVRGWHYHVTPGQFPHILGGYWGKLEQKNRARGGNAGGRGN
ncbi:MAG: sulfatase-like hydrolase/transferase [Planctomycetota bacterium]